MMQETPFNVMKETYLMFPNIDVSPIPKHITWKLTATNQTLTLPEDAIFGSFGASATIRLSLDSGINNTPSVSMLITAANSFAQNVYIRTKRSIDVIGSVGDFVSLIYFTKRGYTRL